MKLKKIIAVFLTLTMISVSTGTICSYANPIQVSHSKAGIIKKAASSKETKPLKKNSISKKINQQTKKVLSKKIKQPAKKVVSKKTISNEDKKTTLIGKATGSLGKLLKWGVKNAAFYGLLTAGIVCLADKVGLVDKNKIWEDVSKISFEDIKGYFNKSVDNINSIPQCISEINSARKGTNGSGFCASEEEKNAFEAAACKLVKLFNKETAPTEGKSVLAKAQQRLNAVADSGADDLIKFWNDTRCQRNFMSIGAFVGPFLGWVGSLFGFTNFGLLYGAAMGLTLYNYKTETGAFKILAPKSVHFF